MENVTDFLENLKKNELEFKKAKHSAEMIYPFDKFNFNAEQKDSGSYKIHFSVSHKHWDKAYEIIQSVMKNYGFSYKLTKPGVIKDYISIQNTDSFPENFEGAKYRETGERFVTGKGFVSEQVFINAYKYKMATVNPHALEDSQFTVYLPKFFSQEEIIEMTSNLSAALVKAGIPPAAPSNADEPMGLYCSVRYAGDESAGEYIPINAVTQEHKLEQKKDPAISSLKEAFLEKLSENNKLFSQYTQCSPDDVIMIFREYASPGFKKFTNSYFNRHHIETANTIYNRLSEAEAKKDNALTPEYVTKIIREEISKIMKAGKKINPEGTFSQIVQFSISKMCNTPQSNILEEEKNDTNAAFKKLK